jgi:hypothetical protein
MMGGWQFVIKLLETKPEPMKRRSFLKESALAGGLTLPFPSMLFADSIAPKRDGELIVVSNPENGNYFEPLEEITFTAVSIRGIYKLYDGAGHLYHEGDFTGRVSLSAGGKLGNQVFVVENRRGKVRDIAAAFVNTSTRIEDHGEEFERLLATMYWTMRKNQGAAHKLKGNVYYLLMGWFQDHVHVMKGMKYFYPELKSGIDLFADGQREDGMIYDNYYLGKESKDFWSWRFNYENFVSDPGDGANSSSFFVRIPIENMSEFTFLEGLYYTWKATGDDTWMASRIDNAKRAIEYGTSNPWRWSEKFNLMKRAYTIDIWDFLPDEEAARFHDDVMAGHLDKTHFGILYADNIGMAVGCEYVAEMLSRLGRNIEATQMRNIGNDLRKKTDELCWNGSFYTHRIPEDPSIKLDFGNTDESKQVTLSNAYALNKRIDHEKALGIIKTYQKIRDEMPASSPGEWYMCYPPFEKGWHIEKWEYMNGGVSGITAGELAHGAFEHGYEAYATDILRRVYKLSQTTDDYLECIYRGAMPDKFERELTPLNIAEAANANFGEASVKGVPRWMNDPVNAIPDFPTGSQRYEDIPFEILDGSVNNGKSCLGLSSEKAYKKEVTLDMDRSIGSIYLLHNGSGGNYTGKIIWQYEDHSEASYNVLPNQDHGSFTFPKPAKKQGWPVQNRYIYKVAWKSINTRAQDIGVFISGIDNPHPELKVKSIQLIGPDTTYKWMICAITVSDKPHAFMPPRTSFGAPDSWAAAAVTYALIEGLAGVKDTGVAFDKALVAPRWEAAKVQKANAYVKYEASGGYVAYHYNNIGNKIMLDITSNAQELEVRVLLNPDAEVKGVLLNTEIVPHEIQHMEESKYVTFQKSGFGVSTVEIVLE